ncbi:RluA family pseudouridine synthase [Mycoplasma sp. ATU-Cv-703]|uniref:pseudouridine synthase family protein n=1 Tax=Mycoplasma sp. ATU-Cv-703 TaxID=2498595 RepID=UPI001F2129A1
MLKWTANSDDEGRTLFKFLRKMLPDVPVSRIERLFRQRDLTLNSQRQVAKNYQLQSGDLIVVYGLKKADASPKSFLRRPPTFKLVYEDKNILVVSKPAGLIVHGKGDNLDEQVLTYLRFKANSSFRPSHVGRLDQETSGLIIYAKNYLTLTRLNAQQDQIEKTYLLKTDRPVNQEISLKLADDRQKGRQKVAAQGKISQTVFWNEKGQQFAQLKTGRKHQIRVTLAELGQPIWGDKKYGGKPSKRLYLHCHRIKFSSLKPPLDYLKDLQISDNPQW